MPYGLTSAQRAVFEARQGVVAGLFKLTYADGTVERLTDGVVSYARSGDGTYSPDRTIVQSGTGGNDKFVLRWAGYKDDWFDADHNAQGATLEVRIIARTDAQTAYQEFHRFKGTSSDIIERDDFTEVTFVHLLYSAKNVNPFILSRHHQRLRDDTDSSLDRISDYARTDFGQGVG